MLDPIAGQLSKAIGAHVIEGSAAPVAGGSIHQALRYRTQHGSIFLKIGPPASKSMFVAEAAGLRSLTATNTIRVPAVLALGDIDDQAFVCLEWLDLVAPTRATATQLGERLAALHRVHSSDHGWTQDNFIGRTPQHNDQDDNWPRFFRERRLLPQLALARANRADRHTLDRGHQLTELLEAFFASYRPTPSLLHGDLWGGNWGAMRDGKPAVFDPAVYYGDRETDLAMTRLFGGFDAVFYAAYEAAWPLDAGASGRATLYNLYHVLNHFNLFGGGYLAQAKSMIERLLAELGR
jgi:fructosamine-3-kinase